MSREEFTFEANLRGLPGISRWHNSHISPRNGRFIKGTVDDCDILPGFALHADSTVNVCAHLLASVVYDLSSSIIYRSNQSWPFNLITKCETVRREEQLKFHPLSDFFVSKSMLPRHLVEVNSKSKKDWPEDLVRMLLPCAVLICKANDAFALQISTRTGSRRPRTLCFLSYIFGKMAK